jgi:hypothetical protein
MHGFTVFQQYNPQVLSIHFEELEPLLASLHRPEEALIDPRVVLFLVVSSK